MFTELAKVLLSELLHADDKWRDKRIRFENRAAFESKYLKANLGKTKWIVSGRNAKYALLMTNAYLCHLWITLFYVYNVVSILMVSVFG